MAGCRKCVLRMSFAPHLKSFDPTFGAAKEENNKTGREKKAILRDLEKKTIPGVSKECFLEA